MFLWLLSGFSHQLNQNPALRYAVLLIFSDKALVGTVCLLDDDAWGEEHIEGSILTCIQGKRHGPLKRSSSCSDEEELDPCDICGRTYFHKHIT